MPSREKKRAKKEKNAFFSTYTTALRREGKNISKNHFSSDGSYFCLRVGSEIKMSCRSFRIQRSLSRKREKKAEEGSIFIIICRSFMMVREYTESFSNTLILASELCGHCSAKIKSPKGHHP